MKLELLNIDHYVKNKNILEVSSGKYPGFRGYDETGLWSEQIFGKLGSKHRKTTFGYINLKSKFIHPIIFKMFKVISDPVSRIILNKQKFSIKNKKLIEDVNGFTGISFILAEFNNIDFTLNAHKEKLEDATYIEKNKDIILIDKFLVLPAGDRDINLNDKNALSKIAKINDYYRSLIFQINNLSGHDDIDNIIKANIQNQLVNIVDHIRDESLKGKKGLIRNNMMKKTLDYSARVLLSSSPLTTFGKISLPWHVVLNIYEPLVNYHLFNKDEELLLEIKSFLQIDHLDNHDLISFLYDVAKNPENIPDNLKYKLIELAKTISKDQIVICKRDPVLSRQSWFSAEIEINEGRVAILNSLDLKPIVGDCDGDQIAVIPLFTTEAKEDAKKMNPRFSKSKLIDPKSLSNIQYSPYLDAIATIYMATKNYE